MNGPARPECGGPDLEFAAGNQTQDFVAEARHPHVAARLVPFQSVCEQPGGRRHVLFVLVPSPLGVDGGAEAAPAQVLVIEIAFREFRQSSSQR